MQDLSSLAKNSMWVTSQAGGNMQCSNKQAMTAPGSQPVDRLSDQLVQEDPTVEVGTQTKVGTDGKRQAKGENWSPPGAPAWTNPPAHSN